jgi:hypothetical protein
VAASTYSTVNDGTVQGLKLSATKIMAVSDRYHYSFPLIEADTSVASSVSQAVVYVLPMTDSSSAHPIRVSNP